MGRACRQGTDGIDQALAWYLGNDGLPSACGRTMAVANYRSGRDCCSAGPRRTTAICAQRTTGVDDCCRSRSRPWTPQLAGSARWSKGRNGRESGGTSAARETRCPSAPGRRSVLSGGRPEPRPLIRGFGCHAKMAQWRAAVRKLRSFTTAWRTRQMRPLSAHSYSVPVRNARAMTDGS